MHNPHYNELHSLDKFISWGPKPALFLRGWNLYPRAAGDKIAMSKLSKMN